MFVTQTLRRAVQTRGNHTASVYGDRRQTYNQFQDRISRLAGGLLALGVQREDRVAILSLNSDRYLEYLYAVAWAGAACNPVNIRLAPPEIAYTLDDSATEILFIDDTYGKILPALRPLMKTVKHVIFTGDGPMPEGCLSYEDIIRSTEPVADANVGGETLAGLFYTGGTTGKSKGVMLTHSNIVFNALNVVPVQIYDEHAVYLHAAPMFHLADLANTYAVTMLGATHVIVPRFEIDPVLAILQNEKVTHCILVPTMINMLLSSGKIANYDLSNWKQLMYGASPMPEALLLETMRQMPSVRLMQGYGQTEAAPLITSLAFEYHKGATLRSAGRAVYGVEVAIMDTEDREVPRGSVGEICARGANVMRGYWRLETQTRETLRNGWLHTGDIGYMDADGFVFIVDRAKDMIISGGENIFSVEVEGAIYQHPAVQECAVIGIPSDQWGELVHAVVVPKAGATLEAEAIIAHCRSLIAGYKVPRSVQIRHEPLPVSGAGKILKTDLRKPFWEGRGRAVN
ncbi:MAG: long-chain-fatty-acid--CoA ligase [Panacagrimonas sp.]